MIEVHRCSDDPTSIRLQELLSEKSPSCSESLSSETAVLDVGVLGAPLRLIRKQTHPVDPVVQCPVRLLHSWAIVGPLSRSGRPCSNCLLRRWLALRPASQTRTIKESETWWTSESPWLSAFGADRIWQVILGLLDSQGSAGSDHTSAHGDGLAPLCVVSLDTSEVRRHLLLADSGCTHCHTRREDSPESARLELKPVPKPDPRKYRVKKLQEISLEAEAFLNPVCGLLGPELVQHQHHYFSSPVAGVFCDSLDGHAPTSWGGHTASFRTSLKAGLLEGLERHAGLQSRSRLITITDSHANLGQDALDPRSCGLYEADSYVFDETLTPFTPNLKVNWIWGYSLTQERPILVPAQMVFYGRPAVGDPLFVRHNSSGCASGSCLEEAILYGLTELVERDTFVITWLAKLAPPRIDPSTCRKPETIQLLARLERLGYDVHLLDMRLDLPIPSVTGFIERRDRKLGALVAGAGANMDPDVAIHTALSEITSYTMDFDLRVQHDEAAARSILADFTRLRDLEHHSLLYGLPEMLENIGFLKANPVLRSVEATYRDWELTRPLHDDLLSDVNYFLDRLRSIGLDQVIVVDQTSPEQDRFGIKTVCVIVPGLMPIDFGYKHRRASSLRRMYTVPVSTGSRASELTPGELNPIPHFFP